MYRYLTTYFAVLLCFSALIVACQREVVETTNPLNVTSAKDFFVAEAGKTERQARAATRRFARTVLWDQAKQIMNGKLSMVVVPIQHSQQERPTVLIYSDKDKADKKERK